MMKKGKSDMMKNEFHASLELCDEYEKESSIYAGFVF